MTPDTLLDRPAWQLSRMIHAREVSCRELMAATLARIAAVNPVHNAIVALRDEGALLAEASDCDAMLARGESKGWMHGLPQAIKDIAHAAGLPTTLGSPLMRGFVAKQDSLMVERMKAAGCVVIGKTNTPEFGLGSHSFNEVYGVTRNAWDPSRSAGGSSGGAAVALATRMLSVADGSDTMGSLRNPAGWNNVFGMRPSFGRVPFWPAQEGWVTQLGTEGPMARTVRDVALLLDTQAGWDARVPLSIAAPPGCVAALDAPPPRGGRIGWLGDLDGHLAMEPGVLEVCADALRRFEGLGHAVEPTPLGHSPQALWQAWLIWRRWIVAARIRPFLAEPANRASIKPEALWEHDQGEGLTATQVMAASIERSSFLQSMLKLFERYDVLALPSAQVWPFPVEWRWPQRIGAVEMDTYHRWMEVTLYATFAGLPAISVPAGFSVEGWPMGLQLIGRPQGDAALLQFAQAYEGAAQDILLRRP